MQEASVVFQRKFGVPIEGIDFTNWKDAAGYRDICRATMTQTRLNVLILHVHKNRTDQLSLTEVGNEFVKGSSNRTLF